MQTDVKEAFAIPRFTGERFDAHTLPVDVARDLAAYEELIMDLAKHLYLQVNPKRKRVPRGFSDNFRLDIEKIEKGSTKPHLVAMAVAGGLFGYPGEAHGYFEQARDLVAECVAASANALPERFPKELLSHFNQLGRSLREGEAMELPRRHRQDGAVLTPTKRKELVLAAEKTYEKEAKLSGVIMELDWAKSTFRLHLTGGGQCTVPMPDAARETVREFVGRERHQVVLKGVAAYDSWDRLKSVITVDSLEVIKNHAISSRLDEIAQLKDGWFDGGGFALDTECLAQIADYLADYPDDVPLPLIVPTQGGNLLLEWQVKGVPSLDIDLANMQASFHAFDETDKDIERDFDLKGEDDWRLLFQFLGEYVKGESA